MGVYSMFATSTKIYAGGDFDKAGSTARNDFAEADISSGSGTISATNPNADDIVYAIDVQGTTITYGGNFRFSNFVNKNYLAALQISTGAIASWTPLPDSYVFDIAVNYNRIFVVGQFDNVNSTAHPGAAAFNLRTGALFTWNPQLTRAGQGYYADLNAVLADSNTVYLGGNFDQVAGTTRNNAAIVAASNASLQSWNPGPSNIVRAMALDGSNLFVGGDFTFCKGAPRYYIAKIDSATGLVNTSWNPGSNGYVYAISGNGSNIYAGGSFTQFAGTTRTSLASVAASSGNVTSFDPVIQVNGGTGTVYALSFDSAGILYAGGSFNTAKGSTRNNLAAFSTSSSGSLKSWNPNANNIVYALTAVGSNIYVGGSFTSLNGSATRNYLACLNNTNGTVTSFNPNMNGSVICLTVSGNNLYAGGQFSTVKGGTSRSYAASYDATTGALKSWNPVLNSYVYGIAAQTDTVYLGGYFTTLNGGSFNRLAAVKGNAGTSNLSFNPDVSNLVRNEYISENTLLTGGSFATVGGVYRNGFAVYKLPGNNSFTSGGGHNIIAESATAGQLQAAVNTFTVYPNPAHGITTIKLANAVTGHIEITVTDMHGNKIMQQSLQGNYLNYIRLNLSAVKNGTYIITVTANNVHQNASLIIAN